MDAARQYTDYSVIEAGSKAQLRAEQLLRHALIPGHNKFFDRVSRLPGGLKFLIDMREDLMVKEESSLQMYYSSLNLAVERPYLIANTGVHRGSSKRIEATTSWQL